MNFEQEFRASMYGPWKGEYVNFEEIQFNLSQRRWTQQEFESALRAEADKVDLFINKKQREIESRIVYCERTLSQTVTPAVYETTDDTLTEVLLDLNDLSKYTRYNFLALQRLIQEAGSDNRLLQWLRTRSLDKQRFDVNLVKISTLHDQCRLHGQTRTGSVVAVGETTMEKAKYWVHPDNITELKAILLFHLPVAVHQPEKEQEASDSAVSNVYFDNRHFELYQGRLQRDEGAEAIRCAWTGTMENREICVERKTHHASWKNGASVKDRLVLDVDQVGELLSGRYSASRYADDLRRRQTPNAVVERSQAMAHGVQQSIRERGLEPMMRVFYHRTVFEVPGDVSLRITLDTDLSYLSETEDRIQGAWRRPCDYPFEDAYSFPYAILETSVQTPPDWLTRLVDSRLVYEVPRFSKYLQGIASLWNSHLPLLPWWLDQLELDIRNAKQPQGNFRGLSRSKSLKPLIDGQYRAGYLESQLERSAALQRIPQRASNPFEDPVWNEPPTPTASSLIEKSRLTPDGGQPSVFADSASTDFLIRKSTHSSYLHNEKMFKEEVTPAEKPPAEEEEEEEDKPKKKKKKKEGGATVEPKIFFANERTFIHWLHFSAIILSVALTLLNFGDHVNRIVGGIFFAIAFIFAVYAFGFYRWRAYRITNKPHLRFDDVFGPVFLCILLVGALVLNFALRFNTPPQNNAYLGVNGTESDN
ncbi:VTC domain-containing protein [Sporodiniella umbellata]|nr:VTC domain-containing protein [Sporodiniella umbellata]